MKHTPLPFLTIRCAFPLLLVLGLALPALAHRIQVVAYPSGGEIVVEASFGNNEPVITGSEVTVTKGIKGAILIQGQTNSQGRFRFPIPDLKPNTGLLITVNSGLGHLGSRALTPEELELQHSPKTKEKTQSLPSGSQSTKEPSLSPEEQRFAELVTRAVAREVEPLKRMLSKEMNRGPSLQDIIGGIGWLVGIGGLLAALKKKR